MRADKKVALVTGASRGLGKKLALGLADAGFDVAVHFRFREEPASRLAGEIRALGRESLCIPADLSDPLEVENMVQEVVERCGGIHLLVNNAAVTSDAAVVAMSEGNWDEVLNVNLSGPFYAMRAAWAAMRERGGGTMVNIVSMAGVRGSAGQANYASAKAALVGLTRAAAREWGADNIRVNAVSPGFMDTDMTRSAAPHVKARALEQSCLNRFCDPDDVVLFVKALVQMQGVTGQVFHLDSRIP